MQTIRAATALRPQNFSDSATFGRRAGRYPSTLEAACWALCQEAFPEPGQFIDG